MRSTNQDMSSGKAMNCTGFTSVVQKIMSTLKQIRENNKKRYELDKNKDYTYPKSISLVAKIMKEQNKMLINKICDLKKTTSTEREEILNEFLEFKQYFRA